MDVPHLTAGLEDLEIKWRRTMQSAAGQALPLTARHVIKGLNRAVESRFHDFSGLCQASSHAAWPRALSALEQAVTTSRASQALDDLDMTILLVRTLNPWCAEQKYIMALAKPSGPPTAQVFIKALVPVGPIQKSRTVQLLRRPTSIYWFAQLPSGLNQHMIAYHHPEGIILVDRQQIESYIRDSCFRSGLPVAHDKFLALRQQGLATDALPFLYHVCYPHLAKTWRDPKQLRAYADEMETYMLWEEFRHAMDHLRMDDMAPALRFSGLKEGDRRFALGTESAQGLLRPEGYFRRLWDQRNVQSESAQRNLSHVYFEVSGQLTRGVATPDPLVLITNWLENLATPQSKPLYTIGAKLGMLLVSQQLGIIGPLPETFEEISSISNTEWIRQARQMFAAPTEHLRRAMIAAYAQEFTSPVDEAPFLARSPAGLESTSGVRHFRDLADAEAACPAIKTEMARRREQGEPIPTQVVAVSGVFRWYEFYLQPTDRQRTRILLQAAPRAWGCAELTFSPRSREALPPNAVFITSGDGQGIASRLVRERPTWHPLAVIPMRSIQTFDQFQAVFWQALTGQKLPAGQALETWSDGKDLYLFL